jgi:hypothetical protein
LRVKSLMWAFFALLVLLGGPVVCAQSLQSFHYLRKPIDYAGAETNNPIAGLEKRLATGVVKLRHDPKHGYLRSLLQALDVPAESQVLVFSKTAFNKHLIGPKTPRAIYFNDAVYVGWTPGIDALEISAVDPQKGAVFYTLPQKKESPPKFQRVPNCLTCHATSKTLSVPGHVLRSYATDNGGNPLAGVMQITHDTPLSRRWGGWYVTGLHGKQTHRGNIIGAGRKPTLRGNLTSLKSFFDVSAYPVTHSDIVALMVLDHQTHIQNLLTRLNYETRLKRKNTVEDKLLRYLFFVDEPSLKDEVTGTSEFSGSFEFLGPEDSNGRSLRQFDLKTRLFKYRLSFQVYSDSFQHLPTAAKSRMYRRIWRVLTGRETDAAFQKIPQRERKAILEILRETVSGLPDYYK